MVGINKIEWGDWLVIALYFLVTILIGVWTIVRTKGTLNSVFLAGRSITWWAIGMSLFASNIGSINFIGIAGTGAASGIAVILFEWNAIIHLVMLGWLFMPVYMSSGVYTMPEYLQRRFGGQRLRIYLTCVAMITYLFATLSVDLFTGSLFIEQTLGWNLYISVAALLLITFVFTGLGGLRTVILTDVVAVVVMIAGGFVLFIVGIIRVGGFSNLYSMYMAAIPNETIPNTTCGYPREDAFNIYRDAWHADFPSLGLEIRTVFGAIWFWCANQVIVQRALAAKNIIHAKGGCIFAAVLKLCPIFIMVLPGMISRALFPDEIACATPERCNEVCGNPVGCTNIAYPKLVTELLPHGLRGLLIAAIIAAVISSLTSIFNSNSALFTMDIWTKVRPKATERELLIVGKLFVLFLTIFSLALIPTIQQAEGGQIYKYAVVMKGYLGGPTCTMFLMAIFWKRMNEQGAFWGLVVGQIFGLTRVVLEFVYIQPKCGEPDTRPWLLVNMHAYYHIAAQLAVTAIVTVIITCLTKPPTRKQLAGTTFWTTKEMPEGLRGMPKTKEEILLEEKSENQEPLKNSLAPLTDTDQGGKKNSADDISITAEPSTCMNTFLNIIGLSEVKSSMQKEPGIVTLEEYEQRMDNLKETKKWKIAMNCLALFLLATLAVLCIYFR